MTEIGTFLLDSHNRTSNKFGTLKDKLSFGAVAGVASQAVQMVAGELSGLVGEGIEASDAMDKFKSTMQLAGLDSSEIKKAGKAVEDYADKTVYELNDVSNTTAQLAANGIKNYTELTQAAGNLNAQAGGSAETFKSVAMVLTQTAGAGKLTTENWNQMADAMPGASKVLQDAMKKNGAYTGNFRDAMEKGQISADEFNQAIVQLGMTDGAKKAAANITTFEGAVGDAKAKIVSNIREIIKNLGKDNLTGIITGLSDSVSGVMDKVADGAVYLANHKDVIGDIGGNLKDILIALGSGVWEQSKDIIFGVADMFGLVDDKTKEIKDPLEAIDSLLQNLADHKEDIEKLGKAIVIMFAVKKGFEFVSMLNDARKAVMEFSAVQSLMGGGISLPSIGKTAVSAAAEGASTAVPEAASLAAGASSAGLLGKFSGLSKLSSLTAGLSKLTPVLAVLSSATELLGNKSTGAKVGGFGGSLGGTAAGAALGTALLPGIGTALGAVAGSAVGSKFGEGFGESIQKAIEGKPIKAKAKVTVEEKQVQTETEKVSKKLQPNMDKLNKAMLIKMNFDPKTAEKTRAQTDKLFGDMSKTIDDFYADKQKKSKKDLDNLVKQGLMTQEEEDKALAKQAKADEKAKKAKKDSLAKMQKDISDYYQEITDIQNDNTKDQETKNKELEKAHQKFVKQYVKDALSSNAKVTDAVQNGADDQEAILKELIKKKGKLNIQDLEATQKQADKEYKAAVKPAQKARDDIIEVANDKYNQTKKTAEHEWKDLGAITESQYKDIVENADKQRDDTVQAAKDQYKDTTKKATDQHNEVTKQIRKQKDEVTTAAQEQATAHATAASGEMTGINASYGTGFSGMADIWNGIISGIMKVLNGLHDGFGDGLKNIKIDHPKGYATGTSGLPSDEIALVGEEGFELAHHPLSGIFPIGMNGPEIRPLAAGTSILPHHMSKEFMEMTSKLPAHVNGWPGDISDTYKWLKEKAANATDWIGDKLHDAVSFVTEGAGKAFDSLSEKLGVSDFLKSLGNSVEYKFTKGAFDKLKDSAVSYLEQFFGKYASENGGSGTRKKFLEIAEAQKGKPYKWGAAGPDAFDCSGLVMWALGQLGIGFPHFSGEQFNATQAVSEDKAKPGDLAFFGPGGTQHVGIYTGPNRMFNAMNEQDGIGFSTIHGFGEFFAGIRRIAQLTDSSSANNPKGAGVDRWIPLIRQAAAEMKVGLTESDLQMVLRKIRSESNGDPEVVNNWDINAQLGHPSKGLLQYIQGTLDAYVPPGVVPDLSNGYTQLLAAFNNSNWREDLSPSGGWGPTGLKRFSNGGEVTKPTLAWIGEDPGAPNEFVINPAKPNADGLIAKVIRAREKYMPASELSSVVNNNQSCCSQYSFDIDKLADAIKKQPIIAQAVVDADSFNRANAPYQSAQSFRRSRKAERGLALDTRI